MSEWKTCTLHDIVKSANTGLDAIKRAPIVNYNSGIRCLRIQDISQSKEFVKWGFCSVEENNYKKYALKKGDIIIARTGATIGVNILIQNDLDAVYNNGLIRLRINEELAYYKYIYINLTSKTYSGHIESISGGTSTQPNMQIKALLDYEIKLPSIDEQKAIAEILSSLDDKIELLNRQNKTLEDLAQTYFRQWFIEGEHNDWNEKGLDEIAVFLNGLALQKYPYTTGEPLKVVKIKELNNGFSESTDLCNSNLDEKYIVNNGDVIFAWSGSLSVDLWKYGKGALNQHLFKVTSDTYPKWFYYFWIKYHMIEFLGIAEDKATTMGHIQRHHLSNARVLIPDDFIMMPLLEKIILNNNQLLILEKLRDTLLPKLISGEVRVKM